MLKARHGRWESHKAVVFEGEALQALETRQGFWERDQIVVAEVKAGERPHAAGVVVEKGRHLASTPQLSRGACPEPGKQTSWGLVEPEGAQILGLGRALLRS